LQVSDVSKKDKAMEGSAIHDAMSDGSIPAEFGKDAPGDMRQNYRRYIQRALRSIKSSGAEHAHAKTDMASLEGLKSLPVGDNRSAHVMLEECVRYWDEDKSCEKLVVVLDDRSMVDCKGNFIRKEFESERDEAIVDALKRCKELDFCFAGLCDMYDCESVTLRA
jgi:hypothetical protein